MNRLYKRNFLNTRPKDQAASLNQLIEQEGGSTINFPCIEIISSAIELSKAALNTDYAIFMSANAVPSIAPQWNSSAKIIAIGTGTAKTLENFQLKANYLPKHFSSEGILALEVLQKIKAKKISVFCGANSKPLLTTTLKERAAIVNEYICYQRKRPTIDLSLELKRLKATEIHCIISTSLESLNNLVEMLGIGAREWLLNSQLLVISPEMLKRAQELGFKHEPLLAENASDEAILKALLTSTKLNP